MDQQEIIADLERKARLRRLTMSEVCSRAKLALSTYNRWKKTPKNPNPKGANLKSIERLYKIFDEVDAEDAQRLSVDPSAVAA